VSERLRFWDLRVGAKGGDRSGRADPDALTATHHAGFSRTPVFETSEVVDLRGNRQISAADHQKLLDLSQKSV
jgi:hypothetical protein